MKKKLSKPGLNHVAKSTISLYATIFGGSKKDTCSEAGQKYSSPDCKTSKCGNGAGGC